MFVRVCFFFNDTATTEIYTLSLHDALPISRQGRVEHYDAVHERVALVPEGEGRPAEQVAARVVDVEVQGVRDRKSTRLNSSHANISYAVFCLKKKKKSATEIKDKNSDGTSR